jgi:threonine dehydrogenase-like Zn-dependent dehydrogenase
LAQWRTLTGPEVGCEVIGEGRYLGDHRRLPADREGLPNCAAMNRNLTINTGNCNHRKYIPAVDPSAVLTKIEPVTEVLEAYKAFDQRQPGWIKVELLPRNHAATA